MCSPTDNVVRGHFEDTRHWDIAVATTFADSSGGLFVFFGGDTLRVEKVCAGWALESPTLRDAGSVDAVVLASPKSIREYAKMWGYRTGSLSHDGIEVVIPETASTIYFRSHDGWIQYDGMD